MRQYTAGGGDVQVPRGGIYLWRGIYGWRKAEPQEIDARIGKANAVLRELYCSVFTKRELSNTAKLSVFKSIFVPILTYGHESWEMTERKLTQVQAPKLGFLRRVHGVTNGRTEVRLRPGQETSLASPYLNLSYFGIKCPALKKKTCNIVATFRRRPVVRCPGHCAHLLRPWCDTSVQSAQLGNSQCPECRTTSSNWENTTTLVRPGIHNAQRKTGEASPAG